jgi:hypothetical protein
MPRDSRVPFGEREKKKNRVSDGKRLKEHSVKQVFEKKKEGSEIIRI